MTRPHPQQSISPERPMKEAIAEQEPNDGGLERGGRKTQKGTHRLRSGVHQ